MKKKMTTKIPIAVACSDIHLSLKQPACRADKDWMEVQASYLRQLRKIAELPMDHGPGCDNPLNLPILCAGDIFDRWNPPPELIRFALEHLPDGMFCVPGQHDLPNHRIDEMHRSAYGVLVKSGKIVDISGIAYEVSSDLWVYGFAWDQEILPYPFSTPQKVIHMALVHKYIWTRGCQYPDAPEELHIRELKKPLRGYDVAVFGDNHKGFLQMMGKTTVLNCGGFIRRKSDEMLSRPQVGIIYSDGTVETRLLDITKDRFHAREEMEKSAEIDMQKFLEQLNSLGDSVLDFREVVRMHLESSDVSDPVKKLVRKALESGLGDIR